MSDEHGTADADRLDEAERMARDRVHCEVGVRVRIVGEAHAELIERIDVKIRRQMIEDRREAAGGCGRRPLPAVYEHERLARAAVEIARPDSTNVDELGLAHHARVARWSRVRCGV